MNKCIRKLATIAVTVATLGFLSPLLVAQSCGPCNDVSSCNSGCSPSCGGGCLGGGGGIGSCLGGLGGCFGGNDCQPARCSDCYMSVFGGFNEVDDYDFVGPATFEGSFKDGWALGAAAGKQISPNLRAEFEYTYRESRGDDWIVNGNPGNWTGEFGLHTLMTNLLLDLNSIKLGPVTPYVGGGIGLGLFGSDMRTAVGTLDIDGAEFAYQGIIGANMRMQRNSDLFLEYRYLATSEVDILNGAGNAIGSEDPTFHTFLVGLRFYR